MKQSCARLALPLLLVATLLTPALFNAPPAGAVPPTIGNLRTDGSTAVYIYGYYETSTLYAVHVQDGTSRTLATNASYPDVSGDFVVWQQGVTSPTRLAGTNLSNDTALTLPTPPGDQMRPAISGTNVVWVNHDTSNNQDVWTIQAKNLATNQVPTVVATIQNGVSEVGQPKIAGQHILWSEQFGGQGTDNARWELWTADFNGTPKKLASGSGSTSNLQGYDLGGDLAVYGAQGHIHAIGVVGMSLDVGVGDGYNPTTDGRYVFWNATPVSAHVDVLGFDVQTDSHFVVAADGNQNISPRAANGVVLWLFAPPYEYGGVIKAQAIGDVLPNAAQPNPGKTSPDWFYFPETQHYLSFGFKNFWVKSGGLSVFGYPLTEEFSQGGYTVQYLERQRYEYHPEFAGTPYETELGLLGTEAANSAGLLATSPFAALPANTTSDSNCTFVAATDHRLCGSFKLYWQSHGLDFGDNGVTYRESLALFGYPISEEFTDPTSGLTVQYFERAVFEYHPNNPDPYKVELRLLGSQRLQSYGW